MLDSEEVIFEESSGNVFADLGLPNPEERQARVKLAVAILRIMEDRNLSKPEAAKLLGVTQGRITALQGIKLGGFTTGELLHFASALEHDVVLELRPRLKRQDETPVMVVNAA